MWVTVPEVLKSRFSWVAGWRLPLAETVDCTTPRSAVTSRVCAPELDGGPTMSAAVTPAAMQSTPRRMFCGPTRLWPGIASAEAVSVKSMAPKWPLSRRFALWLVDP